FEARLGKSHDVVARHRALRAEIGEREQRASTSGEERTRALGQCREAVARNVVRGGECGTRKTVEEVPGERLARREGDRMHDAVERTPVTPQLLEQILYILVARDIA